MSAPSEALVPYVGLIKEADDIPAVVRALRHLVDNGDQYLKLMLREQDETKSRWHKTGELLIPHTGVYLFCDSDGEVSAELASTHHDYDTTGLAEVAIEGAQSLTPDKREGVAANVGDLLKWVGEHTPFIAGYFEGHGPGNEPNRLFVVSKAFGKSDGLTTFATEAERRVWNARPDFDRQSRLAAGTFCMSLQATIGLEA